MWSSTKCGICSPFRYWFNTIPRGQYRRRGLLSGGAQDVAIIPRVDKVEVNAKNLPNVTNPGPYGDVGCRMIKETYTQEGALSHGIPASRPGSPAAWQPGMQIRRDSLAKKGCTHFRRIGFVIGVFGRRRHPKVSGAPSAKVLRGTSEPA